MMFMPGLLTTLGGVLLLGALGLQPELGTGHWWAYVAGLVLIGLGINYGFTRAMEPGFVVIKEEDLKHDKA